MDITLISKEEYRQNKKKYKEHVVFDGNDVINDKEKIMNLKKLKLENQIIRNFLMESDLLTSLMILRSEIKNIYKLSESIAEYAINYKEKNDINLMMLKEHLEKEFDIKIQRPLLNSLTQIVKDYFNITLIEITSFQDVLGKIQ